MSIPFSQTFTSDDHGELPIGSSPDSPYGSADSFDSANWPISRIDFQLPSALPQGPGKVGFKNLGNTCFMNSVLQALIHLGPLARYFISSDWQQDLNISNQLGARGEVAQAFSALACEVWRGIRANISPYSLKEAICGFSHRFFGYDQHDAHEFLTFLLDGLHEDLNRNGKASESQKRASHTTYDIPLQSTYASDELWSAFREMVSDVSTPNGGLDFSQIEVHSSELLQSDETINGSHDYVISEDKQERCINQNTNQSTQDSYELEEKTQSHPPYYGGQHEASAEETAINDENYSEKNELDLNLASGEDISEISEEETSDDEDSDAQAARSAWKSHKEKNDSAIVDLFHGQLRSRLVCPE
jgi:ubiquitin C-terminal hydrolase